MQTVGIRDLVNRGSAILDQLQTDKQPVLITKHGRPVAVLHAIDQDAFYDHVLAQAPEFVADRNRGDADIASGNLGTPMDEVFTELES